MSISGTAAAIAYDLPFRFRRNGNRCRGERFYPLLEMTQPLFPKRGRQDGDQTVVLAVAIITQSLNRCISQPIRRRSGGECNLAQQCARVVKHADNDTAAVIAALEQGRCHLHKAPGQCQCLGRVCWRNLLLDRPELALQIGDERLAVLPVHKAACPRNAGQTLGDLPPSFLRTLRAREFQPKPPLGHGGACADLNQQIGQTCGAQCLKVLCV